MFPDFFNNCTQTLLVISGHAPADKQTVTYVLQDRQSDWKQAFIRRAAVVQTVTML